MDSFAVDPGGELILTVIGSVSSLMIGPDKISFFYYSPRPGSAGDNIILFLILFFLEEKQKLVFPLWEEAKRPGSGF
jgi:hypothetical protein